MGKAITEVQESEPHNQNKQSRTNSQPFAGPSEANNTAIGTCSQLTKQHNRAGHVISPTFSDVYVPRPKN